MTIPLAVPHLAGNEQTYLQECLDTNFVSSVGPFVSRFEKEFAAFVGARHAVACSSGTAALHVALRIAGVGPGTLVAVSDFTFIASANAISYTGADLLLVDSEPATWNMDTERLHDHVVSQADRGGQITNAVEIVHVLGHPAQMEPLIDLRERYGVTIVEDAAEALGATWTLGPLAGRQVGTVGALGCYSFNGNKVMTTGNGGMIVTDDRALAERARHLTTQAKSSRHEYRHDEIGYNYRLSNVAAALGVAQLEQLPSFLDRKREIAARYQRELRPLGLHGPPSAPWAAPSYWLSSVSLDDQDDVRPLLAAMRSAGIGARSVWPPLHVQDPYRATPRVGGAVAEDVYGRTLSLPSSVDLDAESQGAVIRALAEFVGSW